MAYLKVYKWEDETWPEFQGIKVTRERQAKLLRKLSRHFKVSEPRLTGCYKRGSDSGQYFQYLEAISLHKNTSIGTLIHEFAHHLNWKKYKKKGHAKSFKKCLKRVYRWSRRYLTPLQDHLHPLTFSEFYGTL